MTDGVTDNMDYLAIFHKCLQVSVTINNLLSVYVRGK